MKSRKPRGRNKTSRSRKKNPQNFNKPKGVLLEKIVAAFYNEPGITVKRNAYLYPASGDTSRRREIDVLLTANVAGLPVKFAFQCKNEQQIIDVHKIDCFVGALLDVGIPLQNGIFVSVNGFTAGAIKRAKEVGIKTLVLKGLTPDRLKSETVTAIQHNVYLLPRIVALPPPITEPPETPGQEYIFSNEEKKYVGNAMDLIFSKWLDGEIPAQIGEHLVEMEIPEGWFQYYKGEKVSVEKVFAKVYVLGVVLSFTGQSETHTLIDAETKQTEKFNANAIFNLPKQDESVPLKVFVDETELNHFIEESGDVRLLIKSKFPRLATENTYYPLSKHLLDLMHNQMERYGQDFSEPTGKQIRVELREASQDDLFREAIYSFHGKQIPIITTDDNGDAVDVNLLMEKGEFDRVIALRRQYERNPSKLFGNLVAWAYLMKGNAILEKAQTKDGQVKTRLIDESIDKIKCALEINLFMVEAIDDLASALFVKEEYSESLAALNRVLALQPESTKTWADVALVLTKLDRWDEALEPVNKAWKLAEKQMLDEQMMRLILVRRATILHHQKRYKDAWRDIFQAWQIDAFGIIRNQSIHRMLWEIMDAAPSVEGYWLDLEILWYLASEYKKMGEHEAAQSAVNSVAYILARMTHLENITGEVIVSGVVEGSLVVAVLERSFERLQKTEDKTFVEEQFAWVEDLFKRIYQDKPDFLDKYKL